MTFTEEFPSLKGKRIREVFIPYEGWSDYPESEYSDKYFNEIVLPGRPIETMRIVVLVSDVEKLCLDKVKVKAAIDKLKDKTLTDNYHGDLYSEDLLNELGLVL